MLRADRNNEGKPKMSLIGLKALEPLARVLEFGANKYSKDNWRNGHVESEVIDSLLRHIVDLQEGKSIDSDSKLPIVGHIQANAMFLGHDSLIRDLTGKESNIKPRENVVINGVYIDPKDEPKKEKKSRIDKGLAWLNSLRTVISRL